MNFRNVLSTVKGLFQAKDKTRKYASYAVVVLVLPRNFVRPPHHAARCPPLN